MRLLSGALMMLWALGAQAQSAFLPADDWRLRDDLQILSDEGVIQLLSTAWPIPAADAAKAVARADASRIHSVALQGALLRAQARLSERTDKGWRLDEVRIGGGRTGVLRDYATAGREDAEARLSASATSGRWSANVSVGISASPDDGQPLRLDGSDLSVRLGNWLFSANQMDRWWGPGREGSLILSTNARPMPALSFDRVHADAFDLPVLRWLGPWRFSGFLGVMENSRPDVNRPLFLGLRATFKPVQILEVGLSRSAQFCGRDRPCDGSTFWNVLAGRDNAGLRVAPEDEPGNQMGGIDVRVVSPFRSLPLAAFAQLIGEDGSSSGIPERYLGLFGLEGWKLLESGAILQARVEYANTNCKWDSPATSFGNCAYRQGIFIAGYRFHGRNIGHSADADSEAVSLRFSLLQSSGQRFDLRVTRALLDRYTGVDSFNPLTRGPGEYRAAELGWSGRWGADTVVVQAGYEDLDAGLAPGRRGLFGRLQWRHPL